MDTTHEGAAHGEAHPHPRYWNIWFILLVVTVAEVVVAQLDIDPVLMKVSLAVMALYKAVLVALYFMHLKFERKAMWIIASAPLIFGTILAIGTHPDSEKGSDGFKRGDLKPFDAPAAESHD